MSSRSTLTPVPQPEGFNEIPLPPSLMYNKDIQSITFHHDMPHCTPNEIVSEEMQNRLMALDDAMTRAYFAIGDIANDLMKRAPQVTKDLQKIVTQQDVCDAVGVYCHRKGRTVRYYAETAAFYPQDVRDEFDMLPFSSFVVARMFVVHWRDVLEYARDNIHIGEDELKAHFSELDRYSERNDIIYKEHPGLSEIVQSTLEEHKEDIHTPYIMRPSALLLSSLSSLVDRLERVYANVGSTDLQERVKAIVVQVRDLILEVQKKDASGHDIM